MDLERKEILSTYQTLMNSLGLHSRLETLFPLTHEDTYLHIFQTLFPEKILNIMKIASQNEFIKGDRIQSLIDLLSKDVLSIDLTHIRGSLIAKKNLNHILNFLQILLEISNAQKEQAQAHAMTIEQQRKYQEVSKKFGVEDTKEERISHAAVQEEPAHKDKNEDSINDLLGGEDSGVEEIADILYRPKRKTRAGSDDELSDEEIKGGYEQYRTEASPEDRQDSGVQRKRASSSERDVKKKVKNFEEEDELLSNAGKIKRAYIPDDDDEERIFRKLEEDGQISPDNLKYDRVDKYSRKYGKKTKKAPMALEEEREEQYILNEREGFSDKPLKPNFDPKNVQVRYLGKGPYVVEQSLSYKPAKSVAKQVMNLRPHTAVVTVQSQDDPGIDKYEIKRIPQQQRRKTGQRDEDSDEEEERRQVKVSGGETRYVRVGEENMLYNVLSDNINNVRRDLKGIKEHNLPDDEPLTQELLMRQKNTYQNYLSEFLKLQKTVIRQLTQGLNL